MSNHDERGRFVKGNKARQQQVIPTPELGRLFNGILAEIDPQKRTLPECLQHIGAQMIQRAMEGDFDAGRYLLDRFSPPPKAPRIKIRGLPQPSKDPLGFLDRLAREVATGRLSVDDAAKLGRLVQPLVADAALRELEDKFEDLRKRVSERKRLGPGRCEVVSLR